MNPERFDKYIKWAMTKDPNDKDLMDAFNIGDRWTVGQIRAEESAGVEPHYQVTWEDGVANDWVVGVSTYEKAEAVVRWLASVYEAEEVTETFDTEGVPAEPEFIIYWEHNGERI